MVEERGGWFVVNVKDAQWRTHPHFGHGCNFEMNGRFEQTGINLRVLAPGQPACRYHREEAQEDFLVLSGRCKLLVNGEERELGAWDFVHCPPGVTHVFVGAGNGPCAILMVGRRPAELLHYPRCELARQYGAEAPEATDDPRVAYSDVAPPEPLDRPVWPLD